MIATNYVLVLEYLIFSLIDRITNYIVRQFCRWLSAFGGAAQPTADSTAK